MSKLDKSTGFYPDYCFSRVRDISCDFLEEHGIRGLLLDIDNTITRWENIAVPPEEVSWLSKVHEAGLSCRLLSNGLARKKAAVEEQTGIKMVSGRLLKPVAAAFVNGLNDMELPPDKVMMIGDSVFTDIIGANRVGIWTCLVEPLSKVDFIGSKVYRMMEGVMRFRRPKHEEHDYRVG